MPLEADKGPHASERVNVRRSVRPSARPFVRSLHFRLDIVALPPLLFLPLSLYRLDFSANRNFLPGGSLFLLMRVSQQQ